MNLKDTIWTLISGLFKKELIKKFFGAAIGGLKGFLVSLFLDKLLNKLAKPTYDYLIRKGMIYKKKKEVKEKVEKLEGADNENDFNDSFDNIP